MKTLLIAALMTASSLAAASFDLLPSAVVPGPKIYAAQVISPTPDASWASVELGQVALPGSERVLTHDSVLMRLKRSGKMPEGLELGGSGRCSVKASVQVIAGKDILDFCRQYIEAQLAAGPGASIEVLPPASQPDLKVPDRPSRLDVAGDHPAGYRGRIILRVVARQTAEDGSSIEAGSSTLNFLVKVSKPQLVAIKPIARGEKLSEENTELKVRDITFAAVEAFSNTSQAYGLEAKRSIAPDLAVDPSMVDLPLAVHRGDMVKLMARSNGVSVETTARALHDGRAGDSIDFSVEQTKKDVVARVVDGHTAVVTAP
jgi:flagella basal body P-ring formation protein FlgA